MYKFVIYFFKSQILSIFQPKVFFQQEYIHFFLTFSFLNELRNMAKFELHILTLCAPRGINTSQFKAPRSLTHNINAPLIPSWFLTLYQPITALGFE